MLEKNTRSDGRVGEHITDTSSRDAKKCRAAKTGGETEDQKGRCVANTKSIGYKSRGKGSPAGLPMSGAKATGKLKTKNSANDMR